MNYTYVSCGIELFIPPSFSSYSCLFAKASQTRYSLHHYDGLSEFLTTAGKKIPLPSTVSSPVLSLVRVLASICIAPSHSMRSDASSSRLSSLSSYSFLLLFSSCLLHDKEISQYTSASLALSLFSISICLLCSGTDCQTSISKSASSHSCFSRYFWRLDLRRHFVFLVLRRVVVLRSATQASSSKCGTFSARTAMTLSSPNASPPVLFVDADTYFPTESSRTSTDSN